MRKKLRLVLILLALMTITLTQNSGVQAQVPRGKFGLGVVFGEPTGFTGKYWMRDRLALDFGLSYSFYDYFHIYSDALWHWPGLFRSAVPELAAISPYMGLGLGVRISGKDTPKDGDERANLFARIPFGLSWVPESSPLEVFLELVPGMGIAPKVFGIFQGGLGLRYYF